MSRKNNLPSVEDGPAKPQQYAEHKPTNGTVTTEHVGYLSRTVDVRMTGKQPLKFKRIMRYLEDSGAKLSDGAFVNNKRRAALWLIENFEIPD